MLKNSAKILTEEEEKRKQYNNFKNILFKSTTIQRFGVGKIFLIGFWKKCLVYIKYIYCSIINIIANITNNIITVISILFLFEISLFCFNIF